MKLSGRIRKLRSAEGLTQGKIAKKIGVAVSTYQYYERGERVPPADFLDRLMTLFGVDPAWLLTGKGSMYPKTGEVAQRSPKYQGAPRTADPELAEILAWLKENPKQKKLVHKLMKHDKGSKTILEKLLQ